MDPVAHDCVAAVLVRDGCVLLGRRAPDRAWLPDAWDLFGGHLEPGESPEQALARELAEELGVRPLRWCELGVLAGADWHLRVFGVEAWEGEPHNRQAAEHSTLEWCPLGLAQARLAAAHPGFAALLASAVEQCRVQDWRSDCP